MNDKVADVCRPYLIADLPKHERPRERLLKRGSESLSDIELLGIVLRNGRPGQSTLDLARELLHRFDGSLVQLAAASPAELSQVKGIGPAKAAELKATFALAARLAESIEPERREISSPDTAADYFREIFRGKPQEELRCLYLDNRNRIIREELITVGLVDRSQAHPREVFRPAIQCNATRILLAHNHPSGDPTPSRADLDVTTKLVNTGNVVGIDVVDHVVVGARTEGRAQDWLSLRLAKLGPFAPGKKGQPSIQPPPRTSSPA